MTDEELIEKFGIEKDQDSEKFEKTKKEVKERELYDVNHLQSCLI